MNRKIKQQFLDIFCRFLYIVFHFRFDDKWSRMCDQEIELSRRFQDDAWSVKADKSVSLTRIRATHYTNYIYKVTVSRQDTVIWPAVKKKIYYYFAIHKAYTHVCIGRYDMLYWSYVILCFRSYSDRSTAFLFLCYSFISSTREA